MSPRVGVTLGGRYRLQRLIATGGMGQVWEGIDSRLGRRVAVKVLKQEYSEDTEFVERFRAEARTVAMLNHPNIASVHDYGETDMDGEGRPAYLVMELINGEPLNSVLKRTGRLSLRHALDMLEQTGRALQEAHSAGLVHRDVKPGNIMITPDNRVKVTDFGIARLADQVPLTATGQVMGTAQYLAPEQATGQTATASSDLYSLGVIGYECLAGKRPFTGESQIAIALAQVNDPPPPLPKTVPVTAQAMIMCLLSKDPAQRPANATTLASAIDAMRRNDLKAAVKAVPALSTYLPISAEDDQTQALTAPTEAIGADATATRTFGSGAATGQQTQPTTSTLPALDEPRSLKYKGDYASDADGEGKRKGGAWRWIVPLIVLLLAIGGGIWWIVSTDAFGGGQEQSSPGTVTSASPSASESPSSDPSASGQTVTVDAADYQGRPLDAVVSELSDLGLRVSSEGEDSEQDENTVLDVSPTGEIAAGSQVTVSYSTGPESVTLPSSMVGRDADTVIDEITELGVNVTRHQQSSDEYPSGQVIRTSPDSGTRVSVGSNVDVYVSTGSGSGGGSSPSSSSGSGGGSTPSSAPSSSSGSGGGSSSAPTQGSGGSGQGSTNAGGDPTPAESSSSESGSSDSDADAAGQAEDQQSGAQQPGSQQADGPQQADPAPRGQTGTDG